MYKVDFNDSVPMNIVPTTSAADALKELMAYHHITQSEFAEHINVSQKQLSFILNRHAYMSINVARKIEQATGLSARWLLQLDLNYRLAQAEAGDISQVKPFDWAKS
ncbi:helix-turn-helix transcriptional regulator [Lacticaseibacillus chiayiensis]|uniref:Helix-turn-helix domain-containing protein n=2 Tax=Lacticaseibacillus chiayiensis TaxID=2100821 RepID=A0ABY6H9A8_9LACO|nr:helix-turn-helix transcriptional regulator [Lacticaseibacillus chiayiensis]QVI35273.1 helix-turn-helix transcriptional regulator [Lacticaseibacillus chiayiensis]RXT57861.1 XRE family transcriptional regulator [Lacticaseibacillus chiayiensis]UYN57054.1 helix-turn-helix domain-containing protein [Lacticaseibacillus chiayiensis]